MVRTSVRRLQKEAGAWEKELREGRYKSPSRVTWTEFRDAFESSEAYNDLAEACRSVAP